MHACRRRPRVVHICQTPCACLPSFASFAREAAGHRFFSSCLLKPLKATARVQILIKLYGKFWGTDSHAWMANNDLHTTGFSGKENKTTIMTLLDHDLTGYW
jgi:hypothetical protein